MYADPFIICVECGHRTSDGSTKSGQFRNEPCGHAADFKSVCPSWSPVDGCRCVEHLGVREHGDPTFPPGTEAA
jgi:hypothetical protein